MKPEEFLPYLKKKRNDKDLLKAYKWALLVQDETAMKVVRTRMRVYEELLEELGK